LQADDAAIADDVRTLHGLGYAQELLRRMSGFSNYAPAAERGPERSGYYRAVDHLHPGRRRHLVPTGAMQCWRRRMIRQ
jgi:hypothetical protein